VSLQASHVTVPEMEALGLQLSKAVSRTDIPKESPRVSRDVLRFEHYQYYPEMLGRVADDVSRLVIEEGVPPAEIAILAPFLSDALRFHLTEALEGFDVPVQTHRPSRELREEPAARCLLTLTKLAHPSWRRPPSRSDVALALHLAVADLDPVRAHLLARIVYRVRDGEPTLAPFYEIVPDTQRRISFLLGGRYDELRNWIDAFQAADSEPVRLDHFWMRLFAELLSQPGFAFHGNLDAGRVAATLIESARKFAQGVSPAQRLEGEGIDLGPEYLDMVEKGVVAAQYVSSWTALSDEAVLLVPAYTFLMMNRTVRVQFWLDAGSHAWFERIYQPLTHPYILRRDWPQDAKWSDTDEVRTREAALGRLIVGLCRRCRERVHLVFCERNEQGSEQRGLLQAALQAVLSRSERRGP
jgi:hypothetical protein